MRYFLEVSYKGTNYAGFQIQRNALTIQSEVEKALSIFFRHAVALTGSSRTDAGVHAFQNFFHFDLDLEFHPMSIYNINAVLPSDIVIRSVMPVANDAHSRFLATSRVYRYFITTAKNPFLVETAWFYPYAVDFSLLNEAAKMLFNYTDYTSFSKRNTQVRTTQCTILKSDWTLVDNKLTYLVEANRFLRGMVRGLVGTMLLVGRRKITLQQFENIIQSKDCTKANFSTPPHGLFLVKVVYPFLP